MRKYNRILLFTHISQLKQQDNKINSHLLDDLSNMSVKSENFIDNQIDYVTQIMCICDSLLSIALNI